MNISYLPGAAVQRSTAQAACVPGVCRGLGQHPPPVGTGGENAARYTENTLKCVTKSSPVLTAGLVWWPHLLEKGQKAGGL